MEGNLGEATSGQFKLSRGGVEIEVSEFGARLTKCLLPDISGNAVDVVPGMDRTADYVARGGTMGAIVGRYANRISNGVISVGGKLHCLSQNDFPHTMHGGAKNFSSANWRGAYLGDHTIRMSLESPDGDEGWPGRVAVHVDYSLSVIGDLTISIEASADQDTYLNILFHGYWNLRGHAAGSIRDHWLRIAASHYLPKTNDGVSTGEVLTVDDSPFDFRSGKLIGQDIDLVGTGYAQNLCLSNYAHEQLTHALVLADPVSGRTLTLSTNQPGLQLYTANQWAGLRGKAGASYGAHSAVALESQLYPNTPNTPTFNPRPLKAGERYHHLMLFNFRALGPGELEALFEGAL
jgi:aldose 1-epimerase